MTTPARPRLTEHGLEPVPGLQEAWPPGEALVWQGSPKRSEIVTRVFWMRWVFFYLVAMVGGDGVSLWWG